MVGTPNSTYITSPLGTGIANTGNLTGVQDFNDAGGAYTPDELEYLRKYVTSLREGQAEKGTGEQLGPIYGPDHTPHFSWTQGASNMLNALRSQQMLNQTLGARMGATARGAQATANAGAEAGGGEGIRPGMPSMPQAAPVPAPPPMPPAQIPQIRQDTPQTSIRPGSQTANLELPNSGRLPLPKPPVVPPQQQQPEKEYNAPPTQVAQQPTFRQAGPAGMGGIDDAALQKAGMATNPRFQGSESQDVGGGFPGRDLGPELLAPQTFPNQPSGLNIPDFTTSSGALGASGGPRGAQQPKKIPMPQPRPNQGQQGGLTNVNPAVASQQLAQMTQLLQNRTSDAQPIGASAQSDPNAPLGPRPIPPVGIPQAPQAGGRIPGGIDRSMFSMTPELQDRLIRAMWGEVASAGNVPQQTIQAIGETPFNRAYQVNPTHPDLARALMDRGPRGRNTAGYYPMSTFAQNPPQSFRDLASNTLIPGIMAGSDNAFQNGVRATGNASDMPGNRLATKQFAQGTPGFQMPAGGNNLRESLFAEIQRRPYPHNPDSGELEAGAAPTQTAQAGPPTALGQRPPFPSQSQTRTIPSSTPQSTGGGIPQDFSPAVRSLLQARQNYQAKLLMNGMKPEQAEVMANQWFENAKGGLPDYKVTSPEMGQFTRESKGQPPSYGYMPGAIGARGEAGSSHLPSVQRFNPQTGRVEMYIPPVTEPPGPQSQNTPVNQPPGGPAPQNGLRVVKTIPVGPSTQQVAPAQPQKPGGGMLATPAPSTGGVPQAPPQNMVASLNENFVPTEVSENHPFGLAAKSGYGDNLPVEHGPPEGYLDKLVEKYASGSPTFGEPQKPNVIETAKQASHGDTQALSDLFNFEKTQVEPYTAGKTEALKKNIDYSQTTWQSVTEGRQSALEMKPELKLGLKLLENPSYTGGPAAGLVTDLRSLVGEVGHLMGNQDLADWAAKAAPNQVAKKFVNEHILRSIRGLLGPGAGQIRNMEIALTQRASADTDMTPQASKAMLTMMDRINDRAIVIGDLADKYSRARGGMLDRNFPQMVSEFMREHPLLNEAEEKQFLKDLEVPKAPEKPAGKPLFAPQTGAQQPQTGAKQPADKPSLDEIFKKTGSH